MLEQASSKIDRFGWGQMDENIKQAISDDWCDVLSQYTLQEVRDGIRAVFKATAGKLRSINEYQVQEQILKVHAAQLASLPSVSEVDAATERTPEEIERRRKVVADTLGVDAVIGKVG